MKNVLITGASGFVGKAIYNELNCDKYNLTLLLHNKLKGETGFNTIIGDITDYESYAGMVQDIDIIINLVGIIKEDKNRGITFDNLHIKATENIIKLAKTKGIKRVLQISANGSKDTDTNAYQRTKYISEKLLSCSDLDYTIIRSSSIFGKGDKFINLLKDIIKSTPIFPVFGDGNYRIAPVSVFDIAKFFRLAIDDERTYKKVFTIFGSKVYRYEELIDTISKAIKGKPAKKVHLPLWLVRFMLWLKIIPITEIQLDMLLNGDIDDSDSINDIFNIKLSTFEDYINSSWE